MFRGNDHLVADDPGQIYGLAQLDTGIGNAEGEFGMTSSNCSGASSMPVSSRTSRKQADAGFIGIAATGHGLPVFVMAVGDLDNAEAGNDRPRRDRASIQYRI